MSLDSLQARVVGPVLAGLLGQKRVVRTRVLKPSGQGEKGYDAWRLASGTEFLAAKIDELGLAPGAPQVQVADRLQGAAEGGTGGRQEEDDTDYLDEVEVAGAGRQGG